MSESDFAGLPNTRDEDAPRLARMLHLAEVSAVIAHELNNLMTPVVTRADFALSSPRPEDWRLAIERTLVHSRRAVDLAQRLIRFYVQHEPATMERVSIRAAIDAALATLIRPLEKDGHEVEIAVPPALQILAAGDSLTQILVNLLEDSRAATQGGRGRLRISAASASSGVEIEFRFSGAKSDERSEMRDAACRVLAKMNHATISWESIAGGTRTVLVWPA